MFDLEKTFRINLLLDFYSPLLTTKQNEYISLYFKDDLSLSEIAEIYGVSRNAIYDNLTRTIKQLENYEEKLNLLEKFHQRETLYETIRNETDIVKIKMYIEELENLE